MEHLTKTLALGHLAQRRARVGDGNKPSGRALGAKCRGHASEEIIHQDIRLEGGPGLARYDEQRALNVHLGFDGCDLRRIGRVEHVQPREA